MKIDLLNDEELLLVMPERVSYVCNAKCQTDVKWFIKNNKNIRSGTIDFKATDYIDSSGLGMILVLRDMIGKNIKFINCNRQVKNILKIANFHKLFDIKD